MFVKCLPALQDLPDRWRFVRSGDLCIISNGLAKIYKICEKLPHLSKLHGLIELQTLSNFYRPCEKIIRSFELCRLFTGLA
jgi:hypothetical protein